MYDVLIIDLYNLYYRNYFVNEKMTHNVKGKTIVTGGVYGTIRSINKLMRENLRDGGEVYICADNLSAKVNNRKDIDPSYKENRTRQRKDFYRAIDYLMLVMLHYHNNIKVVRKEGFEADDFLPNLIDMSGEDADILVVSTDMDWARVIDYKKKYRVSWHNGKGVVTKKDFIKKYGFIPTEQSVINYKVYRGDSVDNITAGIPSLRESELLQLVEYGSVEDMLGSLDMIEFLSDHWKAKIRNNISRIRVNHQLVSFLPITNEALQHSILPCKYNPAILNTLYNTFGFSEDFDSRVREYKKSLREEKKQQDNGDDFFIQPKVNRTY